jgi:SAM-dependent methyltransferase
MNGWKVENLTTIILTKTKNKKMKVTKEQWNKATDNLQKRRVSRKNLDDNIKLDQSIRNFGDHLEKCGYGNSILDVGCGSQALRTFIPNGINYTGIDAIPVKNTDSILMNIEESTFEAKSFDTICAFAVLDNCFDFDQACQKMKEIARINIIILTGINIEVDKYHTFKLQLEDFNRNFEDMNLTHCEEISPKVYLLNYKHHAKNN